MDMKWNGRGREGAGCARRGELNGIAAARGEVREGEYSPAVLLLCKAEAGRALVTHCQRLAVVPSIHL